MQPVTQTQSSIFSAVTTQLLHWKEVTKEQLRPLIPDSANAMKSASILDQFFVRMIGEMAHLVLTPADVCQSPIMTSTTTSTTDIMSTCDQTTQTDEEEWMHNCSSKSTSTASDVVLFSEQANPNNLTSNISEHMEVKLNPDDFLYPDGSSPAHPTPSHSQLPISSQLEFQIKRSNSTASPMRLQLRRLTTAIQENGKNNKKKQQSIVNENRNCKSKRRNRGHFPCTFPDCEQVLCSRSSYQRHQLMHQEGRPAIKRPAELYSCVFPYCDPQYTSMRRVSTRNHIVREHLGGTGLNVHELTVLAKQLPMVENYLQVIQQAKTSEA